ncbi:hypothetical protein EN792_037010 [Mesorhizobium sp. M00.F.Ca.ET.149.01.1.1]|nr:hypothetical protein EN792_037010 [Mesorhizobium sp. M00.F.Ca.ET.149.01.1.1]
MAARLWRNRWLLAAGVVAVLAVYSFAGAPVYVPLLAVALLAAAAMLPADAERQSAAAAAAIEAGILDTLLAADPNSRPSDGEMK